MKKLLSAIVAVATLTCASTVAFASTDSKDVLAKMVDTTTKQEVYSVDVSWGEMAFTYEKTGNMAWDGTTHSYNNNTVASWSAIGNEMTVTNHSNVAVTASLRFAKDASVSDAITGTFDKTTIALPSAEGKAVGDTALTGKAHLTLSGEASTIGTSFVKVGTVTVSLI